MTFRILWVCLLTVLLPYMAHAQSLECKEKFVSISVKNDTDPTKYVRTKSSAYLTAKHGHGVGAVGGLGGGLIGFQTQTQFEIRYRGNAACVRLDDLDITFFAKPTIHIASNFKRGSCEYGAVMAHEKKHVRELLKFVREYRTKVKSRIRKIVKNMDTAIGPIKKSDVENAQHVIQDAFVKEIEILNQELMPILSERQEKIDSPEEYAEVASKCRGWDKKLYGHP